jgi:hypothetical protein
VRRQVFNLRNRARQTAKRTTRQSFGGFRQWQLIGARQWRPEQRSDVVLARRESRLAQSTQACPPLAEMQQNQGLRSLGTTVALASFPGKTETAHVS